MVMTDKTAIPAQIKNIDSIAFSQMLRSLADLLLYAVDAFASGFFCIEIDSMYDIPPMVDS